MILGLVSKSEHAKVHGSALEADGHEVVFIGANGEQVPDRVEALICRVASVSHKASKAAFDWGRQTKRPVIVEDGLSGIRRELAKIAKSDEVEIAKEILHIILTGAFDAHPTLSPSEAWAYTGLPWQRLPKERALVAQARKAAEARHAARRIALASLTPEAVPAAQDVVPFPLPPETPMPPATTPDSRWDTETRLAHLVTLFEIAPDLSSADAWAQMCRDGGEEIGVDRSLVALARAQAQGQTTPNGARLEALTRIFRATPTLSSRGAWSQMVAELGMARQSNSLIAMARRAAGTPPYRSRPKVDPTPEPALVAPPPAPAPPVPLPAWASLPAWMPTDLKRLLVEVRAALGPDLHSVTITPTGIRWTREVRIVEDGEVSL
jgi:hypothetical protein